MFWKKKWNEEKFWNWFSDNEGRFYELTQESENLENEINEISAKLKKVNSDLAFELLLEGVKKRFFISAGGIKDVFPVVEKMYEKAPELTKWDVVKFKQRKENFGELKIFGNSYNEDSIFFSLFNDDDKTGIYLYFDDFKEALYPVFGQIGFVILDSLLGEYDVATNVGEIDFKSKNEMSDDAKSVKSLASDFDNFQK